MTFYEALRQAADPAMKRPKPTIPSSREPSTATQSHDPFEVPKCKTKSSTHLCITIRWGAAPPSYLSVASGGAGAAPVGVPGGGVSC
jgi:hypothetical protein